MANQHITDLQRDGLHTNLTGLDRPNRVHPRHAMGTWRNFDRPVLPPDPDQAETDNQRIHGERKIGNLRKERMLIVYVHSLIFRPAQRHIATPLVSDNSVIHQPTHDTKYLIVEEELWDENGRLERHREKVAMWAPVRRMATVEIYEQARPERLLASLNQEGREVVSEDAKALFSDLIHLLVN